MLKLLAAATSPVTTTSSMHHCSCCCCSTGSGCMMGEVRQLNNSSPVCVSSRQGLLYGNTLAESWQKKENGDLEDEACPTSVWTVGTTGGTRANMIAQIKLQQARISKGKSS